MNNRPGGMASPRFQSMGRLRYAVVTLQHQAVLQLYA